MLRISIKRTIFAEQKLRIYAEKVNSDDDKARYSSEEPL